MAPIIIASTMRRLIRMGAGPCGRVKVILRTRLGSTATWPFSTMADSQCRLGELAIPEAGNAEEVVMSLVRFKLIGGVVFASALLLGLHGCFLGSDSKGSGGDVSYWGETDVLVPGAQGISWPGDALVVEGAMKPAVAVTGSGRVVLSYVKEGTLWMGEVKEGSLASDALLSLGSASDRHAPRMAAEPNGQRVFVAWVRGGDDGLMGAWWKNGELEAEPALLVDRLTSKYQEWSPAREHSVVWTSEWPVVFALGAAGDVWLEGTGQVQTANSSWYAFAPPGPGKGPLPAPQETQQLFFVDRGIWLGHGEAPRLLDLQSAPDSDTLDYLFAVSNLAAEDGEGYGRSAAWALAWRERAGEIDAGGFYWRGETGTLPLPDIDSNAMWIQIHDDGEGDALLSWCKSAGKGMVYDIFVAPLLLLNAQSPALGEPVLNISNTPGLTDHSEHPVILPAGRGALWVAWRESFFGPRVSAYQTKDLTRIASASAPNEWHLSDADPIAAAVDTDGALLLAATFMDPYVGQPTIRLWRFDPLK